MSSMENARAAVVEVDAIVDKIKPLLAGRGAHMQGLVLSELLSIWLAGHPVDQREDLAALTMEAALDLAELIDSQRRKN